MSKVYDVVIAGAGPIGLFLACELALAQVSVLVLERDLNLKSPWKVSPQGRRGLNTQSIETLYRRGLLGGLLDLSERSWTFEKTSGFKFGGHFAGISLNANKLNLESWKYRIPGPALAPGPTTIDKIETLLAGRAESLGVTILRGHGVTKIAAQDDDSVTVEAGENQIYRGKWLVGCDGGRSVIRKAAEFDFIGTEPKFTGYSIKCDLDHPEKLEKGFQITKTGTYIFAMPDALHLLEFDGAAFDRTQEITQEHLQGVLSRVTGITDLHFKAVHLVSTYTDRCKQPTSYRKGRILLAGDAAHINSPLGAQGLNVGLGDAMNLGWKLAATIRQESGSDGVPIDLALLNTYESERHPIGAWVLEWSRAQVSAMQPDLYGSAVRKIISDLIDTTDGTNQLIGRVWGLSQRYNLGGDEAHAHPLVGSSAPDFELLDGSRLGPKLEGGRGLLVDLEDNAALKELLIGGKYEARVDYIGVGVKDSRGICAMLVRPDGTVVWVSEDSVNPNVDAAKAALEKWFSF